MHRTSTLCITIIKDNMQSFIKVRVKTGVLEPIETVGKEVERVRELIKRITKWARMYQTTRNEYTEKMIKMGKMSNWILKSKGNKLNNLKSWSGSWFSEYSEYLKGLTFSKRASDSVFPIIPPYFTFLLFTFQVPTPSWPIRRNGHCRNISNANIVHSINRMWMLPQSRSSKRWDKINTRKMNISTSLHQVVAKGKANVLSEKMEFEPMR